MKKLGVVLFMLGILLFGYSMTIKPYKNKSEYEEKYFGIQGNNSELFYKLRTTYLTEKYTFENYGLTLLILGLFLILFFNKGWNSFKIPKNKWTIGLIGFGAVLITILGYVGDLFLEMYRGSYPHWADALAIPLAIVPVIFIILLMWYALNLIGLIKDFKTGGFVKNLNVKGLNYWYVLIFLLTIILTGILIFEGDFWGTTAGLMWSYYYLSLLVGRREGVIEKEKNKTNIA